MSRLPGITEARQTLADMRLTSDTNEERSRIAAMSLGIAVMEHVAYETYIGAYQMTLKLMREGDFPLLIEDARVALIMEACPNVSPDSSSLQPIRDGVRHAIAGEIPLTRYDRSWDQTAGELTQ